MREDHLTDVVTAWHAHRTRIGARRGSYR